MPNFTKIEEAFCGQTDGRTYVQTDGQLRVDLKIKKW